MRAYTSNKKINKLLKKVDSIGLVPTMGSLHNGHLSLIKKALIKNDKVIVSIYVNPKQFNDYNDLKKYPRDIRNDLNKLKNFDNIVIFAPNDSDVYKKGERVKNFNFGKISEVMEGRLRPGYFDGVGTIIEKLLKIFTRFDSLSISKYSTCKLLINCASFKILFFIASRSEVPYSSFAFFSNIINWLALSLSALFF